MLEGAIQLENRVHVSDRQKPAAGTAMDGDQVARPAGPFRHCVPADGEAQRFQLGPHQLGHRPNAGQVVRAAVHLDHPRSSAMSPAARPSTDRAIRCSARLSAAEAGDAAATDSAAAEVRKPVARCALFIARPIAEGPLTGDPGCARPALWHPSPRGRRPFQPTRRRSRRPAGGRHPPRPGRRCRPACPLA